jgi:hypothetical protein
MSFVLYLLYVVLIVGPIYLIWALFRINHRVGKVRWMTSQEYSVIRINVPRMNEKSPLSAEQMFATLHGIFSESAKYQYHVSFEIISKEKYIHFFVYVPVHLKDFVQGQIYAQYPNVEIHEVEDYMQKVDMSASNYAITDLALTKPDVYPIKQFTDFEVDPISGITAVMSQIGVGEEIWFQMIIRPLGDRWQEKGHERVNAVRAGGRNANVGFQYGFKREAKNFFKALFTQIVRPGALSEDNKEIKLPASVEEALKGIEQKITKLGFETKIRVAAFSPDSMSARLKCQNVCAAFKQFNTTNLNGFRVGNVKLNDQAQLKDFMARSFEDEGNIFNIAELASIYHFPSSTVATPHIVWSGSKKGEPPANLPLTDNTPEDDFTVLGLTNFRNAHTEFGIKKDDRRRHIYIVGKSGVGKSTLIENMAVDDILSGRGVIIVDPHGETADKALACIPDDRKKDVIVFDPADREFPIAFNILESVDDDFKGLVASGFVGIFKKIFGNSWGPRLEHILRNTVLALLDYPDSTMLDVPRMLTNGRFRDQVLEKVKDPVIREFWMNEFGSFDNKFRTEAVSPILNKVGQFLASSTIRNIVGQPKSRIDIREIMDQQKIMIVNLSRGKIGEDNSALLGAMMITKIQLAAMSRANVTVDKRPDCYLYVDEFQNFATDSFQVILSEARKYNLCLTIAHQYIAQIPEEVRDAVFGNAGTIISFRVGGTDADFLVKEFEPVFTNNDLVNLDKYNIYIKLLVDGVASPAFSAETLPPIDKLTGNVAQVVEESRKQHATSRLVVEEAINSRSTREEEQLKAEAEAFKKGGLEAILLKKPSSERTVSHVAPPVINKPDEAKLESKQESESPKVDTASPASETVLTAQEDTEPKEPKLLRHQNVLDGKIYKERTARGGVKWYLGEDIDDEKLAKSGTIVDEKGKKMIELSLKVANKHAHKSDPDQNKHEGGGVSEKKDDKKYKSKPETHQVHTQQADHSSHQNADTHEVHQAKEEKKVASSAVPETKTAIIERAVSLEPAKNIEPVVSNQSMPVDIQSNNEPKIADNNTVAIEKDVLTEGEAVDLSQE